jgi:hypothetical protein
MRKCLYVVFIFLGVAQQAQAARYLATHHVFPQFVDGRFSDGSYYRTTLMISNPSDTSSMTCSLQLHGLTVPGFQTSYSMGLGGFVIVATAGTQNLQSGYATLDCSANVDPQLMYSYYRSDGTKVSESVTFSSPPEDIAKLLADESNGSKLGIAIANDSDQMASYTIYADYMGKSAIGTQSSSLQVGPRSSAVRFLDDLVPGIPSGSLSGVLISSNAGATNAIGLRFSGNVFSAMPEVLSEISGPTADTSFIFPQFARGKLGDGSYFLTSLLLEFALEGATCNSTERSANGFISGSGTTVSTGPALVVLPPPSLPIAIPAQLFSGYETIQCTYAIDAQELLASYDPNGVKLSEATIFASPSAARVQILADTREGARVGLAIANDSDQPNSYTITMYDTTGTVVGTASQTVKARTSVSKFLDELVTLPSNYWGPVIVSSSSGTGSILGLRFTGSIFSAIPETVR